MRHALILAAGSGKRMCPLSAHTPKPLLLAGDKPLIIWHLERLAAAGIRYIVITTSFLAEQFPAMLGDGSRWGLRIRYSYEGPVPLETGGGMLAAWPLLGPEPFLAISGDIWCDADLTTLPAAPETWAHLLMVPNPPHHPVGDFALSARGLLQPTGKTKLTFSGIGIFRHTALANWRQALDLKAPASSKHRPVLPLRQLLLPAMTRGKISGSHHLGHWTDVGSPERLANLNRYLQTLT